MPCFFVNGGESPSQFAALDLQNYFLPRVGLIKHRQWLDGTGKKTLLHDLMLLMEVEHVCELDGSWTCKCLMYWVGWVVCVGFVKCIGICFNGAGWQ